METPSRTERDESVFSCGQTDKAITHAQRLKLIRVRADTHETLHTLQRSLMTATWAHLRRCANAHKYNNMRHTHTTLENSERANFPGHFGRLLILMDVSMSVSEQIIIYLLMTDDWQM